MSLKYQLKTCSGQTYVAKKYDFFMGEAAATNTLACSMSITVIAKKNISSSARCNSPGCK
ncbi:hypothetical protein CEK25_003251 [Fusarium fujikuroi]|nr:hypothetical protein CEK25_003251 [Fusarium fujikuroi]